MRIISQKVIVISGPTAVGKTDISLELAEQFNGEIVNADSMQIYRHLDIGTAKPTSEERQKVPHHLFDMVEPREPFTVATYKSLAKNCLNHLFQNSRLPFIVGGTGLYLEALLYDLPLGGRVKPHPEFRLEMEKYAENMGAKALHQRLQAIDLAAAEKIHPHNIKRVIRALEVCHFSDQKFSEQQTMPKSSPYELFILGLTTERSILYNRINHRVDMMMQAGLLEEAQWLYQQSLPQDSQCLQAIGYKEFFPYFSKQISKSEAVSTLKRNSRRYAKRQLTWLRNRLNGMHWYDLIIEPRQQEKIVDEINKFLQKEVKHG